MSTNPVIAYILKDPSVLLQKDFHVEIFMIPSRINASDAMLDGETKIFSIETLSPLYKGKLFVHGNFFYAVDSFQRIDNRLTDEKRYRVEASPTGIVYNPNSTKPLLTPQDSFLLEAGKIANYPTGETIDTSIGIYIANYLFLAWPFGSVIPYFNEEMSTGKLEKRIAVALLEDKITARQVKDKYVNALSLFGQSNEVICPNISEKTISIPQSIHDLRVKLIKENLEALKAGDASVMTDIEGKLIKAYKDHLQGDPSLHYLLKAKHFNVALKKLFLVQGMTEIFGDPGKFKFIEQPMGSGWQIRDLPYIFNEVRQGSYARAIETADGGVVAKLILRVFQDTQITIPDCGTRVGSKITSTKEQLKEYVWNYTIEKDGSNKLITDDTLNDFIGKEVTIRTPGFCKSAQGYCARCMGLLFEKLGQKAFAPIANDLPRQFTTNSLKSMHGKSHSVVDVSDIGKYLIS